METQDTQSIQNTQIRSTKDRLDELRKLCKDGYVTEHEFMVARVNILKEGGIDVVTRPQQHAYRPYFHEEEDESKSFGCGCGCFLVTLLLAAFLVLGVSFFAAPYWPDRFGGVRAREAREWVTVKGTEIIDRFLRESTDSVQAPDPVSSGDERQGGDSSDTTDPAAAEESATIPPPTEPNADQDGDVAPTDASSPGVALPSLNMHILSLPPDTAESDAAEPDITVTEIQTPVSAESDADPGAENENTIRGYVTTSNARIRSAPDTSTNDNVLGWARVGDRLTILEEGSGRDGSRWYHVIYEDGDKRGWISGSLVRLER